MCSPFHCSLSVLSFFVYFSHIVHLNFSFLSRGPFGFCLVSITFFNSGGACCVIFCSLLSSFVFYNRFYLLYLLLLLLHFFFNNLY